MDRTLFRLPGKAVQTSLSSLKQLSATEVSIELPNPTIALRPSKVFGPEKIPQMRGLLWVLALFALAVGISLAMHVNDGYVLLVMPPYRAEISSTWRCSWFCWRLPCSMPSLRAAALTLSLPRRVRGVPGTSRTGEIAGSFR